MGGSTGWIRAVPKPLGLLAHGDCQGIKLCSWCVDAGVAVPREVAVLGRGNVEANCENAVGSLSSVAIDYAGAVEVAARLLETLIKGDTVQGTSVVMPPLGVATRESTDVTGMRNEGCAFGLRAARPDWCRDGRSCSLKGCRNAGRGEARGFWGLRLGLRQGQQRHALPQIVDELAQFSKG